ncbi:MAG: hypothetical protein ACN4GM_14575, partial [Gammaproteobacteria bacterium]
MTDITANLSQWTRIRWNISIFSNEFFHILVVNNIWTQKMMDSSKAQNYDSTNKVSIIGFFKGTQSLTNAFWFIGVMPAVILYIIGMALVGSSNFVEKSTIVISVAAIFRFVAWFCIFRCLKNTESEAFKIIVSIVVIIDIIHKLIYWPIFY